MGWRVLLNRIQTKENLVRRNVLLCDPSGPWCNSVVESASHLLFGCTFAWDVWGFVLKWLRVFSVLPIDLMEHFTQFSGLCHTNSKTKSGLLAIWLATVWCLWTGRNKVIFKEEVCIDSEVFELVRIKVWSWLKARNREFQHSLWPWEWINEPLACLSDL